MKIHQLQIVYQMEQDRILVRLNSSAGDEFRLSLTRRMVKMLFPHITQASKQSGNSPLNPVAHDGADQKVVEQFKRRELLQNGDFQTPFSSQVTSLPIGEEPLLATTVHLTRNANSSLQLGFEEKIPSRTGPRSFQVTLDESLLEGFMYLLESAVQQADWGFSLVDEAQITQNRSEDSFIFAEPSKYLN